MGKLQKISLVVAALLGLARLALAQNKPVELIDKAIKATGGADQIAKLKAFESKAKGTLDVMGMQIPFAKESKVVQAGKFKESMQMDVGGQKITMNQGYNGKTGWINANGTEVPVSDKIAEEFKHAAYLISIGGYAQLKEKPFTLSPLGETKVNNRPAVGIKVSNPGHRDIDLYFDKDTGLMAKMEFRAWDIQMNKEVNEERIVTEYADYDGLKVPKKAAVQRDGKKIMDLEVTEIKFLGQVDDSEFEKP
jgi:hypothetical protein